MKTIKLYRFVLPAALAAVAGFGALAVPSTALLPLLGLLGTLAAAPALPAPDVHLAHGPDCLRLHQLHHPILKNLGVTVPASPDACKRQVPVAMVSGAIPYFAPLHCRKGGGVLSIRMRLKKRVAVGKSFIIATGHQRRDLYRKEACGEVG